MQISEYLLRQIFFLTKTCVTLIPIYRDTTEDICKGYAL